MKLKKPQTSQIEFRRELPGALSYLANGETPFIAINSKVGGYLNPALMDARDKLDLKRRVASMEMGDKSKSDYAAAMEKAKREFGEASFAAIYDCCVVDWQTNIINDVTGEPAEPTRDNFLELAGVRVPEISEVFVAFTRHVDDVAAYIRKADEETEKN